MNLIVFMDSSILEELGLTKSEIKVYVALNKVGECTAKSILKESGLQNSVVHATLQKLLQKGFISYIKKSKIKHYRAADPSYLLKYLDDKRNRIKDIIPELISMRNKNEPQGAEIFEGVNGFKTMYSKFMEGANEGDEYLFFSFQTEETSQYKNLFTFYDEMAKERNSKKIITKGILPIENKKLMEAGFPQRYQGLLYVDFPILSNMSILNDKVFFTPWEDKEITFLVQSRQLANCFKDYFNRVWDENKKNVKHY